MQSLNAPASSLSLPQISSDIQFGDRNPALLHTEIADCLLRKEYSVRLIIRKLEQVVNASKSHIISAGFMVRIFTDQSVYYHISNCRWNYKPSGVCERGFSRRV